MNGIEVSVPAKLLFALVAAIATGLVSFFVLAPYLHEQQPVDAEVEIPDWVQDNITSEGEKSIILNTYGNKSDELVWLIDHNYHYCGLTNTYTTWNQVLLAKPGWADSVCQ